jgi:hypothetical protein
MPYELFEGKGIVRKVKLKKDKEFFDRAKKKLGFPEEIDLVTFCTAIALYKEHIGESLDKKDNLSLKEMAKMYSFKKGKLYDFIILNRLEVRENRLEEFEKYFYVGFEILREWFEQYGPDATSEIERFCGILDCIAGGNLDD